MAKVGSIGIAVVAAFGLATSSLAQEAEVETPAAVAEMAESITGACSDISSVEGLKGCVTNVFAERDQAIRTIFVDIAEDNPAVRRIGRTHMQNAYGQCGADASRTTRYLTAEEIRQSASHSMNECIEAVEAALTGIERVNTGEENLAMQAATMSVLQDATACLDDAAADSCSIETGTPATTEEDPLVSDPLLSLPQTEAPVEGSLSDEEAAAGALFGSGGFEPQQ